MQSDAIAFSLASVVYTKVAMPTLVFWYKYRIYNKLVQVH